MDAIHTEPDPVTAAALADSPPGQREIYGALMTGLDDQQRHEIEFLMASNIQRLVDEGDSYST